MTFQDVLAQAIDWLQRDKRVTYRALKRQFDLDDEYLEDLKDEIIEAKEVAKDEKGKVLVWTGAPASSELDTRHRAAPEIRFHALLRAVIALLQRERRVTYRELKHVFGLDDTLLNDLQEELFLKRLAIDEDSKVLVWIGETSSSVQPLASGTNQQDTGAAAAALPLVSPAPQPHITAMDTPTNGPSASPEGIPTEASSDGHSDGHFVAPQPIRRTPEAERRQLTVMFCDLADSTKLSQQLDPEDLREVIRAYQQTSAEVIQHFDGYVAQHLGDGLLIYFGWPRAHEDDAQRALHSGLGIVEAITTALNPRLEQEKGVQLTIRLGVHTGPVVVGQMGSDGRQENLATGETVNIAARLEGLAAPNTTVISDVTARLVEGGFALADMGTQVLKGVTEPIQVFQVLSPIERHEDDEASRPYDGMFLVGRDEEVGLLLRRWEQSKDGLGQVVFISGEAGIGKSSLTATMRTRVAQEGATRITFRCSPYHTNSALYPVNTHLEQMLGFERGDSPDAKLDKLEQALKSTNLPLEESVPLLANLLSVPVHDRYPTPTTSPQQQRQQTVDTLVAWLIEESEKQPVLAVWEDLHWTDPSTLEMLGLVLEQSPTVSMFNVLTFRPEFSPPWPTRSHMTPLTLNRLERLQVEALITHLARGKALPSEVVEHIVTKTDGVPLYVEELTKMLLASELLREEADHYALTGPLSTVAIPDTLQDSLMARLDQLNQAKEVAQLGAVLGREFSYEMLQAITSQDDEPLQASLTQLVEAELLYQRGRPPRARYIFKHALIQDAAYASLLRSTRQQVHHQITQVLKTRFAEVVETQPELLAYHCTEAGQAETAIHYWQRAGQRAIQRSSYVEAITHLREGLALLMALPETPTHLQQELDLQVALGPALLATKGYAAPDAERAYTRARELCQQIGDTSHLFPVMRGLMSYYLLRGQSQTAHELGEQLLCQAQDQYDPALLIFAHGQLGTVLFFRGELASAHSHHTQALALYTPQEHQTLAVRYGIDLGVASHNVLALELWYFGYPEQAMQASQQGRRLAQEVSHLYSLATALAWAVVLHQFRREVQAVYEQAAALKTLVMEHGFAQWSGYGPLLHGWAQAMQGQSEQGIAEICQGLAADLATGSKAFQPYFLGLLAEVYGKDGHYDEGLNALAEALAVKDSTEVRFYESELHRLKGELLLAQSPDGHTEAESCFYQALDVARYQRAKSLELRAATCLARLWQSQHKRKEAYDLLAPVYDWFTEGFDTADLQDAKALLDELR
jgi:predicted ATPase/class 3 adenylate cyclase